MLRIDCAAWSAVEDHACCDGPVAFIVNIKDCLHASSMVAMSWHGASDSAGQRFTTAFGRADYLRA
ncbi:MAG TPA: hypothetical protein PLP82_12680, partial [Deltaproteobacteria bacterium]|nr:hypothetical protein [Deltaproteobacteria bacterium]